MDEPENRECPNSYGVLRFGVSRLASRTNRSVCTGRTGIPADNSILIGAYSGSMDIVVPFLKAGGPATYANAEGNTLLHAAADGWQFKMVEFLVLSGSEVNAQNHDGDTPLHMVTFSREVPFEGEFLADYDIAAARSQTFAALLLRGAKTEMKNKSGATPLHLAAWSGDVEAVSILAPHTPIDVLTTKGATPLVLAVLNDHVPCARCLLKSGADARVQLPSGQHLSDVIHSSPNRHMRSLFHPAGEE